MISAENKPRATALLNHVAPGSVLITDGFSLYAETTSADYMRQVGRAGAAR
jgi:hypothetical protein